MILNAHMSNGMFDKVIRFDTETGAASLFDGRTGELKPYELKKFNPETIQGISSHLMFTGTLHVPFFLGWGYDSVSEEETEIEGVKGFFFHIKGKLKIGRLIPVGYFNAIYLEPGEYKFKTSFSPMQDWSGWFND